MSHNLPITSLAQKAHDMRSLLALLQADLANWQSKVKELDPESQLVREASAMYANTQRLGDLLGALLYEAPTYAQPQFFDLDVLVEDILADYRRSFPKVKFIFPVQRNNSSFKGLQAEIAIALRNIIENALKYGQDKEEAAVLCSLEQIRKKYHLTITDNGPGIEKQDLNKVFIPFFRGRNVSIPGSGLGLAIAKDIIQRHHGKISIESTAGKGTKVKLMLPIM